MNFYIFISLLLISSLFLSLSFKNNNYNKQMYKSLLLSYFTLFDVFFGVSSISSFLNIYLHNTKNPTIKIAAKDILSDIACNCINNSVFS